MNAAVQACGVIQRVYALLLTWHYNQLERRLDSRVDHRHANERTEGHNSDTAQILSRYVAPDAGGRYLRLQ
jgi:hypothetical protein